jgi:hypothetical protein
MVLSFLINEQKSKEFINSIALNKEQEVIFRFINTQLPGIVCARSM